MRRSARLYAQENKIIISNTFQFYKTKNILSEKKRKYSLNQKTEIATATTRPLYKTPSHQFEISRRTVSRSSLILRYLEFIFEVAIN